MVKNMGTVDRVIRALLAVVIAALYLTGQIGGWAALILGIVAVALLLTSVVGTCPGYLPFRISTRGRDTSSKGAQT